MTEHRLDLGPEEAILHEYSFAQDRKGSMTAVLTSKRLVILQGQSRETHPLNRIRAVRVEAGRSWGSFISLILCAVFFATVPIVVARMTSQLASIPPQHGDADFIHQGNMFSIAASIVAMLCLLGSYFAFRGYTSLGRSQRSPNTFLTSWCPSLSVNWTPAGHPGMAGALDGIWLF